MGKEEKQLSLKPNTLLEILKRRSNLESWTKINRELKITKSDRVLNDFIDDWPRLIKFMKGIRNGRYTKKEYTDDEKHRVPELARFVRDLHSPERVNALRKKSLDSRDKIARMGKWPHALTRIPVVFIVGEDRIPRQIPEKVEIMRDAFNRVAKGEVPWRVAKETADKLQVNTHTIMSYFRNVLFAGYIPWRHCRDGRGGRIAGSEEPVAGDPVFSQVQARLASYRKAGSKLRGPQRFAKVRVGSRKIVDKTKIDVLREICSLRKGRMTTEDICIKTGVSRLAVRRVLTDRTYRKAVGSELWDDARKVDAEMTKKNYYADTVNDRNQAVIISFLKNQRSARTFEIMKATGLSHDSVRRHMDRLKAAKIVNKEPNIFGRWFLTETGVPGALGPTETDKKILAALERPSTLPQISEKAQIPRNTVAYRLPKLIAQGLVEKHTVPGKRYPVYVKVSPPKKAE